MLKIALTGKQCSGKTTTANNILEAFTRKYILKFAEPLYQILGVLGQPKHRLFMQQLSDLAKEHCGNDIFVKRAEKVITEIEHQQFQPEIILCDDMRYQAEFDMLKAKGFTTVYIASASCVNKQRAEAQGLVYSPDHNSETEVESLMEQCDVIIHNTAGLHVLRYQVDRLLLRDYR